MGLRAGARLRDVARAGRRYPAAGAALAGILVVIAAACVDEPPTFSIEPAAPVARTKGSRSLYVGYLTTPPPGEYRFARIYDTGVVEAQEISAVNGPGPWVTYTGQVEIPPESARELFSSADATPADPVRGDGREACVLALGSASGVTWQGCASPALAARVLSIVPRLIPPPVAPGCSQRICQVRFVRETPPVSHDRHGAIERDVVLDASGAFWCAVPSGGPGDQLNTLQVVRGRIARADAPAVFTWLMGGNVQPTSPTDASSSAALVDDVQIRGPGPDWTRVRASLANAATSRWTRIASRFPAACR